MDVAHSLTGNAVASAAKSGFRQLSQPLPLAGRPLPPAPDGAVPVRLAPVTHLRLPTGSGGVPTFLAGAVTAIVARFAPARRGSSRAASSRGESLLAPLGGGPGSGWVFAARARRFSSLR